MENSFSGLLQKVIDGDQYATEMLIEAYMPLINHNSIIDGRLDEDCRQFIIMRILISLKNLKKFMQIERNDIP